MINGLKIGAEGCDKNVIAFFGGDARRKKADHRQENVKRSTTKKRKTNRIIMDSLKSAHIFVEMNKIESIVTKNEE